MTQLESKIKTFLKIFGNVFFTHRCHCCNTIVEFGNIICTKCRNRLYDTLEPPRIVSDSAGYKYRAFSLSAYDSFSADIVKIIKYRPSFKMIQVLLEIIREKCELYNFFNVEDIIVPVPMYPKRKKQRGFNQAEEIAKGFANIIGCHYSDVLLRKKFTKPQAECNEAERLINLNNSLFLNESVIPEAFYGKQIILVDDVMTTGTTMQKCADELIKLRPAGITALSVAHSFKKN